MLALQRFKNQAHPNAELTPSIGELDKGDTIYTESQHQDAFGFTFCDLARARPELAELFPDISHDRLKAVVTALVSTSENFFPLKHLSGIIQALTGLVYILHSPVKLPRSILITGPKGIGKTFLFRAINHEAVLRAMREEPGNSARNQESTFTSNTNLSVRQSWPNFSSWAMSAAAAKLLQGTPEQRAVANILRGLPCFIEKPKIAGTDDHCMPELQAETIREVCRAARDGSPICHHEHFWRRVDRTHKDLETRTPLEILSSLLRAAKTRILYIVDEAEVLFQDGKMGIDTAQLWMTELQGSLANVQSAFGVVVCASFQRAGQLFLADTETHEFPTIYRKRAHLRSN